MSKPDELSIGVEDREKESLLRSALHPGVHLTEPSSILFDPDRSFSTRIMVTIEDPTAEVWLSITFAGNVPYAYVDGNGAATPDTYVVPGAHTASVPLASLTPATLHGIINARKPEATLDHVRNALQEIPDHEVTNVVSIAGGGVFHVFLRSTDTRSKKRLKLTVTLGASGVVVIEGINGRPLQTALLPDELALDQISRSYRSQSSMSGYALREAAGLSHRERDENDPSLDDEE